MFEQIREKTAALNAQIAVLNKEAADMVKPLLTAFVKDNPQVKAIKWAQYTPYFNDGDACVFGVGEFGFFFEGDDLEASHYEGEMPWEYEGWEKAGACSPETFQACRNLAKELSSMDDALETLFGDHAQVVVTADGVDVEEYDHD